MNGRVYCPPPVACEPCETVLRRFGGTREADGCVVLPGGRVYGDGIVLSADGTTVVDEFSKDFGGYRDGRHWLQTYAKMNPSAPVPGRVAVVAVNLGARYAHWLLEELPRWLSLRGDEADSVIAHVGKPFIDEVRALAKFPQRVIPTNRYQHFACETLVVPPLAEVDARTAEALNVFARRLGLPATAFGEKLYITRENAERRRVVNEDELWAKLEARGFVKLRLEELSWREQVAAISGAKVLVSAHGAGLANVVFCREGARVVEFFNRSYVNPCFERWARLVGTDYRAVVPAGEGPVGADRKANREDIVADVAGVLAAIERE